MPGVPDVNEAAVLGLERVAGVELGDAVGANHLPVSATVEDAAADVRAFERPAKDGNDPAAATRDVPQFHGRAHLHVKRQSECERRWLRVRSGTHTLREQTGGQERAGCRHQRNPKCTLHHEQPPC